MTDVNGEIVFVYSGMGPQWYGMGVEAFNSNTVFRSTINHLDKVLCQLGTESVERAVIVNAGAEGILPTNNAQTANFMVQLGIARVLESHGVKPGAVIGHSIGEFSAAYTSGALTLHDACTVVVSAANAQEKFVSKGAMLFANLSEAEGRQLLDELSLNDLAIAAINGPKSITIAGPIASCDALSDHLIEVEIFNAFLDVEVPFHHPIIQEVRHEIQNRLKQLKPQSNTIPFYSTVTGGLVSQKLDASYWSNNLTEPVLFLDAISEILDSGFRRFIHIGAHPVLQNDISEICDAKKIQSVEQMPTLSRRCSDLGAAVVEILQAYGS